MVEEREELSQKNVEDLSKQVCENILKLSELKDITAVGIYLSLRNEVMVEKLFEPLHAQGKLICTPIVSGTKNLDFVRLDSLSDLKKGPGGVREPKVKECILETQIEALVIPGIAFDPRGYRVGWGRGYYDTFLSKNPNLIKIGAAYDFQIIDRIEAEDHDIKMDYVVTEKRILKFR